MEKTTTAVSTLRVLVVDDHPLIREGIAGFIEDEPGMQLVGEASSGVDAIRLFGELRPDVTLMDLRLPDMSGIAATIEILAAFPDARVVILTTYQGDVQAQRALKAGAAGYLLKSTLRRDLISSIRLVNAGGRHVSAEIASEIASHFASDALSDREVEVLQLVAQGQSNRGVAVRLDVSEDAIKGHMKNILAKLRANDRTHAVTIAFQRGIIDL